MKLYLYDEDDKVIGEIKSIVPESGCILIFESEHIIPRADAEYMEKAIYDKLKGAYPVLILGNGTKAKMLKVSEGQ